MRRYPGCPAGVRALALSLIMLGLNDSATLAPLAFVGAVLPGAGLGVRAGLVVVTAGGVAAAAVIVACHACQAAAGLSALGAAAG